MRAVGRVAGAFDAAVVVGALAAVAGGAEGAAAAAAGIAGGGAPAVCAHATACRTA